jgi:CO/xanthine dehydrogenase Mo-binding subunit
MRGAAAYPTDVTYPDLAHAALVRSTIASGRVTEIDDADARAAAGVLSVITHQTAPKLTPAPFGLLGPAPPPPLQDDRIHHHGQYVGVVVAATPNEAAAAARLVKVDYKPGDSLTMDFDDPRSGLEATPWDTDTQRGDVDAGLAEADIIHEATYTTAANTNNPLGLFATVAAWEGDTVTVHDATQWPAYAQATIAGVLGIEPAAVRVHAPYVGGAFGAGLFVWQHVILTVLAARAVGRPVKLVLTRPEMFTGIGHRPSSVQTIRMGARRDGELVAIEHVSTNSAAIVHASIEPISGATARSYACVNVATTDRQRRLNIPLPGSMRGPGHAQGNFALESVIDELAYKLALDPLELRLRNYAEVHPQSGLPWSSNALRECYAVGAERFGWTGRNPEIDSMRDGHWKIGYGLAALSWSWFQVGCQARATITRDGQADVRSAASDPGTGTRTVMRQLSSERLGLPLDRVRFELGDSDMPWSPASGGSALTASLGNAIYAACGALLQRFLDTVAGDDRSPLSGFSLDEVAVGDGGIHRRDDPRVGERYTDILARHGLDELTADAEATPPSRDVELANAGPVRGQVRRGPRRRGPRPHPRRTHHDGRRRRPHPQREDCPQPNHRRHHRRHRPGAARGEHHRPQHRPRHQRHLRRLPDTGQRRRSGHRRRLRRGTGCAHAARSQRRRRDRPRRHRRCHCQRGPSRHRSSHPLASDHPRPPPVIASREDAGTAAAASHWQIVLVRWGPRGRLPNASVAFTGAASRHCPGPRDR